MCHGVQGRELNQSLGGGSGIRIPIFYFGIFIRAIEQRLNAALPIDSLPNILSDLTLALGCLFICCNSSQESFPDGVFEAL